MLGQECPQANESSNHLNGNLDGSRTLEYAGQHQGSMFSEGIGEMRRKFEGREVVTICDHLLFLIFR